ncbi:MAG: hypothetical protein M3Z24_11990 [Chloroflexota bacterium]|nr:hypothetical protein [Chloroflexota bacterium]
MRENTSGQEQNNSRQVVVGAGALMLPGELTIPPEAHGIVVLGHGIANRESISFYSSMAKAFQASNLATLYLNLFTLDEEGLDQETGALRTDVSVMEQRFTGTASWLSETPETQHFGIGYFGTEASGAAALIAAAERPDLVHAVVSCGGYVDLAEKDLPRVQAPTLFIVGENEAQSVITVHQQALSQLSLLNETNKKLETLRGVGNLFEGTNTLEQAAQLASQWFAKHLERIM